MRRPLTTGELADRFSPRLVRTAVMKHLDVLEGAGLLTVERQGRTRLNRLRTQPLTGVASWLKRRVLTHEANLERLKNLVESKNRKTRKS